MHSPLTITEIHHHSDALAPDPDGTQYLLLSNLFAADKTPWQDLSIACPLGAPVFTQVTTLAGGVATATFTCAKNMHIANELKVFVAGAANLLAVQADGDSRAVYLKNDTEAGQSVAVTIISTAGEQVTGTVDVPAGQTRLVSLVDNVLTAVKADFPQGDIEGEGTDVTGACLSNPSPDTAVYDLTGRRAATSTHGQRVLQPGLYIVDGHKKILK